MTFIGISAMMPRSVEVLHAWSEASGWEWRQNEANQGTKWQTTPLNTHSPLQFADEQAGTRIFCAITPLAACLYGALHSLEYYSLRQGTWTKFEFDFNIFRLQSDDSMAHGDGALYGDRHHRELIRTLFKVCEMPNYRESFESDRLQRYALVREQAIALGVALRDFPEGVSPTLAFFQVLACTYIDELKFGVLTELEDRNTLHMLSKLLRRFSYKPFWFGIVRCFGTSNLPSVAYLHANDNPQSLAAGYTSVLHELPVEEENISTGDIWYLCSRPIVSHFDVNGKVIFHGSWTPQSYGDDPQAELQRDYPQLMLTRNTVPVTEVSYKGLRRTMVVGQWVKLRLTYSESWMPLEPHHSKLFKNKQHASFRQPVVCLVLGCTVNETTGQYTRWWQEELTMRSAEWAEDVMALRPESAPDCEFSVQLGKLRLDLDR